eukprot:623422-Prorocentrum_minimum.AAC.1
MSGGLSDSDNDEEELKSPFKSPCTKRPAGRPSEVLSPISLGDLDDEVNEFLSFKTQAEISAEASLTAHSYRYGATSCPYGVVWWVNRADAHLQIFLCPKFKYLADSYLIVENRKEEGQEHRRLPAREEGGRGKEKDPEGMSFWSRVVNRPTTMVDAPLPVLSNKHRVVTRSSILPCAVDLQSRFARILTFQAKLEKKRKSDRHYQEDYQEVPEFGETDENEDDANRDDQQRDLEAQLQQKDLRIDDDSRPPEIAHVLGPATPTPPDLLLSADHKENTLCQLGLQHAEKANGRPLTDDDDDDDADAACSRSDMVEALAREMLLTGWLQRFWRAKRRCSEPTAKWLFQLAAFSADAA